MNYRSYSDLSNLIKNNISRINDRNFDLVVGIPRSGMIPAYMIALYLNISCMDMQSFVDNKKLISGRTRRLNNKPQYPGDAEKVLLVDDSIRTGKSLEEALNKIPENLRKKITTLAVYSSEPTRNDVDIIFEFVKIPRVFEWNLFHHPTSYNFAFDIDGVLCKDPTIEENDDGKKYKDFLLNVEPLIIPEYKVHSLVTNRLEKYRKETEEWLDRNNVLYENLVMLNLPNKEVRQRLGVHAKHKANYYKRTDLELFVESDPIQSAQIAKMAGKSVYCVSNNKIYQPDIFEKLSRQPQKTTRNILKLFKKKVLNFFMF